MSYLSKFQHFDYQPLFTKFDKVKTNLWTKETSSTFRPNLSHLFRFEDFIFLSHVIGTQKIITIEKWKPSNTTFWNMKPQNIEALIPLLGQDAEIIPCEDFSRKSTRTPGQFYKECTIKFASAYCYHQQLLQQIKRKKRKGTAIATLKQIQPLLVRNKHSKLFTSWAKHQAQHN